MSPDRADVDTGKLPPSFDPEEIMVSAFKTSLSMFGYSVHGYEPGIPHVTWRVCESRPDQDDLLMWDRTADWIARDRFPVPSWWALAGFRGARWEHLYGAA